MPRLGAGEVDLDELHLIRVALHRLRGDRDDWRGEGLVSISQGLPIGVGNDGPMGVSHELIVRLQDTMSVSFMA